MEKIGYIHYTDPDAEPPRAGRARPVWLTHTDRGWGCIAEGLEESDLPRPQPTRSLGLQKGRELIRKRGGTSLKHPKMAQTAHTLRKLSEQASERRLQARARRQQS